MTEKNISGISIQSSAPIYSKRQYGGNKHHETPSVPLETNKETTTHSPLANNHFEYQQPPVEHDTHYHTHSHDNTHHDHHDHQHNHDHISHDHHDHDHSGHGHVHSYTPVYTEPLPSWIQIFSRLAPAQKTMFTWFILHLCVGIWLYCMGMNKESLSLIGFSYLMVFDALGVLNTFVSSFVKTIPAFSTSNTKRPFGAHRYEIVFALGTTIYLLFATMYNTKESLEHFLLQDHHGGGGEGDEEHHLKFSLGMFLLMGLAITATCLSSIALRNHDNFVRYLRKRPTTVHGFSYNVINRARGNPIHALLSNIYSSLIVLCGSLILLMYMFGIVTPFLDKSFALFESAVMLYLGYPTAKALAKILLQTTPKTVQSGVDNRLREILQDEKILSVDRVHFWQTTYGKTVGTIDIQVQPNADEQAVLQLVYQKLEGLTSSINSNYDESELTVSICK